MAEKLEVLVVTQNQSDFSLIEKMNIRCGAVIANQNPAMPESFRAQDSGKMIVTHTRGVGINRNIALLFSTADIVLFADDDVLYVDDFAENVTAAFERNPQADVIVFGMKLTRNGEVYKVMQPRNRRLHLWNALRYGTVLVAARRESLLKKRIEFTQFFGGGTLYGSGEDSMFLVDCFKKGLKVFSCDFILGSNARDESSWFTGYNEKYFYDKGALIQAMLPEIRTPVQWYLALRHRKVTQLPLRRILRLMRDGMRGYKTFLTYSDYAARKR